MVTLVLLPGMDGTGGLFAPLLAELDAAITPVVVRYPCNEPLDYTALTSLARAALPREGRYVILGESFSGPIAVRLAAEAPKGLIGLILCASFVANPTPRLRRLRALVPIAPVALLARAVGPRRLMGRFQTAALRQLLRDALRSVPDRVLKARILATLDVDVSAELASVRVPTRYLRATEDAVIGSAPAEGYLRAAREGKVVDVVGPHCLLQCVPHAASSAIRDFLGTANNAQ